ncbi:MAG TPA: hypothetical protein ENJ09_16440 [Planctomycetes bacterium]|nr:hypothetical protein [Planctomycetota bacterium]
MRPTYRALLAAALTILCLELLASLAPPAPAEPLALRWLRAVAAHPLRGGLAIALLLLRGREEE